MASSGVNVKMGVSGVAQFKQNMNQAKQAVKTLDAQLALTEKEFKASGDAEAYMTKKTEELKAKLEQQKSVVSNAEKALQDMASRGVDKASKAYQDMYQSMLKAKGELIDTQQALDNVAGAAQDADTSVMDMSNELSGIGKNVSFNTVTDGIRSITQGLENAARKAIRLGKVITSEVLGAGSWADDLQTRADYYQMDTDTLQKMEKTAKIIDTPVEAIINARKRMKKTLSGGSKDTVETLELLGLGNVVDTDPEEMFWKIGDAIMKMGDAYTQEESAQKLFGRSWDELIPLFTAGREEYEKLNDSWKIVPQEQIDALNNMNDAYDKLVENFETLKKTVLAQFAEPMEKAMTTIDQKLSEFSEWLSSDDGKAFVDSVIGKVQAALEWLTEPENINNVIHGLEAIIAGWAGLKLTGTALDVLKIINGAKGLVVGAGGAGTGAEAAASGAGGSAAGTAVTGAVSKIAPSVQNWVSTNGVAFWDWLTHESPVGTLFQGTENLNQWWDRQLSEFNDRAASFANDWNENVPFRTLMNFLTGGFAYGNEDKDFDEFEEELMRRVQMDNFGNGDLADRGFSSSYDRMTQVAEDSTKAIEELVKQNVTPEKLSELLKVPDGMKSAVKEGISGIKVVLDGYQVGVLVAPYVSEQIGSLIP